MGASGKSLCVQPAVESFVPCLRNYLKTQFHSFGKLRTASERSEESLILTPRPFALLKVTVLR